jgi:hypothetical protein
MWTRKTFTMVSSARAGATRSTSTRRTPYTFVCEETCLNAKGQATGSFVTADGIQHGFLRDRDGTITPWDAPQAAKGPNLASGGASINLFGEITGYLIDSNGVAHGFVRSGAGAFTVFEVPHASTAAKGLQGTAPFSINFFGALTGIYLDANAALHGFSRDKSGEVTEFNAPSAGKASGQGTRPSTNNAEGDVTGWYIDDHNVAHGFLWVADCE